MTRAMGRQHGGASAGWTRNTVGAARWYLRKGVPVAQSYGETGTPTGYLLDARGHIASDLAVGPDALFSLLTAVPLVKRWLQP